MRNSILIAAMALAVVASPAMAAMSAADQSFAVNAAASGRAEVAMGHIAITNGGSPDVRGFGERMVTDHTQANEALSALAHQEDLQLPDTLDPTSYKQAQQLGSMKGSSFDAAYIQDMIKDHQKDIAAFEQEASSGKDPGLKEFASKYLPMLRQHLQMAQSINSKS